ncbi:hypothetical protein [Marinobacter lipolyticus]|uniref:hypothetical protein n=1 Tax=Marinobacter lipolyticus TaxID=209639 RepID=UPI003A9259A3
MTARNDAKGDWQGYLIEALKEDLNSREAEIDSIRNSLRYRVGGWVLEAWPPSHRTVVIMVRMLVAFIRLKKRKNIVTGKASRSADGAISGGQNVEFVVYGHCVPEVYAGERAICSDDPAALVVLLDSDMPAGTLVLRLADQAISRRVERLRLSGWRIVWWPEGVETGEESPQVQYLSAHADECRAGSGS